MSVISKAVNLTAVAEFRHTVAYQSLNDSKGNQYQSDSPLLTTIADQLENSIQSDHSHIDSKSIS